MAQTTSRVPITNIDPCATHLFNSCMSRNGWKYLLSLSELHWFLHFQTLPDRIVLFSSDKELKKPLCLCVHLWYCWILSSIFIILAQISKLSSQLSLCCLSTVSQLSLSCLSAVSQLSLSCLSAVSAVSQQSLQQSWHIGISCSLLNWYQLIIGPIMSASH